jgi:DNA replication and repair protein RecF
MPRCAELRPACRRALRSRRGRLAWRSPALSWSRRELLERLEPRFDERAGELGLPGAALGYLGDPPTAEALEARLDRDLERGFTGAGPHLDDVRITSGNRELRTFGSQGEQRLAVLALLLAETEVIAELHGAGPLLLLDDVLSELDGGRRAALLQRIERRGQALVTTASPGALPVPPAQVVAVEPGGARAA